MELIFGIVGLIIIIVSLSYFASRKIPQKSSRGIQTKHDAPSNKTTPSLVHCPLCNSPLLKGQNIISKVYRPMNVSDQRCTISGCPHCFPLCPPNINRVCPVCKAKVSVNGYLVARLFNRTEGKKHVMIMGCNNCLKSEKK